MVSGGSPHSPNKTKPEKRRRRQDTDYRRWISYMTRFKSVTVRIGHVSRYSRFLAKQSSEIRSPMPSCRFACRPSFSRSTAALRNLSAPCPAIRFWRTAPVAPRRPGSHPGRTSGRPHRELSPWRGALWVLTVPYAMDGQAFGLLISQYPDVNLHLSTLLPPSSRHKKNLTHSPN